jgi:predicted ribosomally synthesized peptide with SipW-like signal peptide
MLGKDDEHSIENKKTKFFKEKIMKKNTKRTLVATLLVMILSLTVLVGSTFAYFNDLVDVTGSVTTGELNTQLHYAFAETLPADEASWAEVTSNANTSNDAESYNFALADYKPGDYTNLWFRFKNVGTLKYTLSFTFSAAEVDTPNAEDLLTQFAYKITAFGTDVATPTVPAIADDATPNFYEGGNIVTNKEYQVKVSDALETIDEGDTVYVCFQIKFIDSGIAQNEYQTDSANFTFKFDARQLAGTFVAPNTEASR